MAQQQGSTIEIRIAADDMCATLSLFAPHGQNAAGTQDIMQALAAAGVVFGIDASAIAQACQLGSCNALPVAAGLAPRDGCDTVFQGLTPHTAERTPKLDENGLIDYREHSAVAVVHCGAALMRRTAATPGVDGCSVRGRILPAHRRRDQSFAAQLKGAQTANDDPNLLLASVSGTLPHFWMNCGKK